MRASTHSSEASSRWFTAASLRGYVVVPRDRLGSRGTTCEVCCGGVLLSHTLPGAVPSALAGLASRFGMEAGRFPAAMTTTRWFNQYSLKSPVVVLGVVLVVIRIVATSTL